MSIDTQDIQSLSVDKQDTQLKEQWRRRENRIRTVEHVFSYAKNVALFFILFSQILFYTFISTCIGKSIYFVCSKDFITWLEKVVDITNKLNTTSVILIISIIVAIILLYVNKAIIQFKNKVNLGNKG